MLKIHVGCGKRDFGPDWYHVDGEKYPHVKDHDVWLSCFQPGDVKLIYASHFIEYFDREEAVKLLKGWRYTLCDGGILRLAVPDFNAMADLYMNDPNIYSLDNFIGPLYGKMQMDGKTIYHKTVYDFASMHRLLTQAGFKNVRSYDWRKTEHAHIDDQSQAYIPKIDKKNGTLISLNVEATK